MNSEKDILLKKINDSINNNRNILLNKLPQVQNICDGLVVRFFSPLNNDSNDNQIKYKSVISKTNSNKKFTYYYIPKGTLFTLNNKNTNNIICLNGELEIEYNNSTYYFNKYTHINIISDELYGKALKNTYILTCIE